MRLLRSAGWLVALVLALGTSPASAADRSFRTLPDTDLPGFDYQVLEGVTLNACQTACVDDNICRAFTYNSKSKWCFLKGSAGEPTSFKGATSGTIKQSPMPDVTDAVRQAELPFPASDLVEGSRSFARSLATSDPAPKGIAYADLVAAGDEAVAQSNPAGAMVSYRQALGLNGNDPSLWLKLGDLALARADEAASKSDSSQAYDFGTTGTYAAMRAFLLSEAVDARASALAMLAHGLERRQMWREAIATYRTSLALVDRCRLARPRSTTWSPKHGFRIVSNEVDSEAATPRICVVFSEPLPPAHRLFATMSSSMRRRWRSRPNRARSASPASSMAALHGDAARRPALAERRTLRNDVELNVYVPDRAPFVGFANNAYVLPAGLGGGLPITSVNAETAEVVIYRIGDRSIATAVRNGIFQRTLDGYSAEDVANS